VSDVFLGSLSGLFLAIIALSLFVMAAGQVAVFVMAARAVRRLAETVDRLERDVRPIVSNVQTMSADAARATALATAQVERAERLLNDVTRRVEDTMNTVQRTILGPARDGMAIIHGIKAAFAAFRQLRSQARPRPAPSPGTAPVAVPDPGDEDHASFIG
jgi:outer membrane murein-binding lipoprotein Lpp